MIPTIHIPNTGHPWSTVYAVAAADIPESWLLTGGLMVQLHAITGGLTARPTTDADLLADLMTDRRGIVRLRSILATRGFETQPGTLTGYTTRMSTPNGDVVDLLVADHLPKFLGADHAGYGDRHLYDAAMLASLIPDPDTELTRLHSGTDRKRIRLLHDKLTEDSPYWNNLDESHRQDGLDTIETLATW